jgi:hypothetical protein
MSCTVPQGKAACSGFESHRKSEGSNAQGSYIMERRTEEVDDSVDLYRRLGRNSRE